MKQPAIVPPSPGDAERLRNFLLEIGYTGESILKALNANELPSPRQASAGRMMRFLQEPTSLNALLRWFYLGLRIDRAKVTKIVPEWFIETACASKILRIEGSDLTPEVLLVPFEKQWIASDTNARFEACAPDFVVWPNTTTRFLHCFTVNRRSRATLDLGTGNGVQALSAATYSDNVVGTDLNPRAIEFAVFNARLNGIESVEWLCGDAFEPVKGRKFDLIVSNPPFFIGPSNQFLFCDNSMDLDCLCGQIARDAAAHLDEGGYFQMLCEWAEVEGQSWQERLTGWFRGTGCDVWAVKGQTRSVEQYSLDRLRELAVGDNLDAASYDAYARYFSERKVTAIHNGVVAMRRRSGENWAALEEASQFIERPFGDLVLLRFAAHDFLSANASASEILSKRPLLLPDSLLEQVLHRAENGWETKSLSLKQTRGIPSSFGLQTPVAEFVGSFNGKRSLGELIRQLSENADASPEKVESQCIDLARKLTAHGFLQWE